MSTTQITANTFGLNDENWRKHANPWSVWSRMAAFAVMLAAIYLRDVLGWWTLAVLVGGVAFMFANTRMFRPIDVPSRWDERGIYGERLWTEKAPAAEPHRRAISAIIGIAGVGLPLIGWGLVSVQIWPTVFGWTLVFISQLWQIDRFVAIYDSAVRADAPQS
ncbi:DUF6653 family protein [Nocardia mexicana]|uniref:Uncharacterized protein n=1 Tax=Nocardia mexicana TaxID=279262 RepID=A0A370GNE1_9NOCA|nr:DUF6653 family protein [Nocardia mexicana]RDI45235.1 hypothetical protein DFR68_1134 [Nocardia mexicana]